VGAWQKTVTEAGIIISIMVDDAEATRTSVTDNGGKIVHSAKMDSGEVIVHFTDPAGNIMGIYQESRARN